MTFLYVDVRLQNHIILYEYNLMMPNKNTTCFIAFTISFILEDAANVFEASFMDMIIANQCKSSL